MLVLHQPGPAGAEVADGGGGELFLEGFDEAEGVHQGVLELFTRLAGLGRQAVPEEGVVPDLRGVVEHGLVAGVAGDLDGGLEIHRVVRGVLDRVVEVGHIGVVVLAVVVFQRFLGHVRCEGVLGEG